MKRLYAIIIAAALCFLPTLASAAVAPNSDSHGIAVVHVAATDIELFQIKNARVLHSDQEVQEAWWQSIQQVAISAGSSFQGPGDVVSGAALWGSCARVYNASLASAVTSLCDLVDSAAPTVVICTLRGTSTGFVDLSGTYCTGSVTPATKCAAATGGKCNISKVYDQIGGTAGCTQATAVTQPTLTFSAINGLSGMTGAGAATLVCPNFTATQPNFTLTGVFERTGAFTSAATVVGFSAAGISVGNGAGANIFIATAGTNINVSIPDSAFNAFSFVPNGASSVVNIDNAETTAAGGAGAPTANAMRVLSANGAAFHTGIIMEFGFWGTVGFNGTQRTNMNSNMHGANGYNF